jgi:membrane protein insertase Oxa1/YidC/SpoIIIJ
MAKIGTSARDGEAEERAGDDNRNRKLGFMMKLYKENKGEPRRGLSPPILIQIPIFFSLYKVIFVTLELRTRGSADPRLVRDPSSILNLFGLFHGRH